MEGQNKGEPSAPLHWAARNGHHGIISAMLKAGEGVNTRDSMQRTALHEASVNGHLETVQALLVAGADVNARDMVQTTPLHDAATKGHHETVRALLVAFADVNAQDFEQSTPLHMAAANGTTETVETLLKAGADVNARDREQRTALHLASRNGYDETVRSLLMMAKGRVDLNAFTNQQWTALHLAAMNGQHKAASVLLTAGADVNARDNEQKTALHLAAWNGDWRTVSLLITAGADVNAQDKWCNTPIGEAKKRGHQTCVERLEADKDSRDKGSKQKKGLDPVLIHFYEERGMTTASNKDPLVQEAAKQSGKTVKQVLTFIGYYRQKKGDRKRKSLGDESSNTGAKKGNITADKTNTPGSELPVHGAESVSDQGLNIASSTKETDHERKEKESARVSDHGSAAGESVKAVTEQGPSTSVVVHHHHHHVIYQPKSTTHLGSACNSRLTGMMPASQTAAAVVNVQDNQGLQTIVDQQRPKAVEALQQGADKDHKKEGTPRRKKGFDPVLVQFYEEGGMTTGSVNDPLVQEAARQTGKTVKQVVNFISSYRRSKGETKHKPPGVGSGDTATKSSIAKMSTADPSHQGAGSATWQVQTVGSAMDKEERERKEKEMCEAAKTGDTAKVKQLLDEGVNSQVTSGYMKRTPLHLSSENDHYDIVTALLKAGAAVNAQDVVERTALHLAAVNGHHNLATALLGAGATVNAPADQQWTPVHLAAMNGHHETVTALHKAGADVNARDNEEKIPLHLAANNGYQETVAVLLKAGSNVNTKNNKQRTSMHLAATNGHHETVTLLAAAQNADVNAQDSEQITPLHLASRDGDYETALALLKAGADANVKDKQKSVPLHEAALHGHPKCVEVLLQHGADIAVRNKEGLSTKDIAKDKDTSSIDTGRKEEVILGRKAILKLLQEESSRISNRNKEAQAVLIRYYEEKGMTVVKKDCPLIIAAAEESGKSVEQVRNFISNRKKRASSGKRPADEPAGSLSDTVAKESKDGAKKPRTQARVEDAEKPGCSFQGIETLMEGSIQDGASGSSTDVTISTQTLQSKQDISTSAAISVLLVNDEYGTAHGGVSTMSRGVARLLRKHGAQVYATALKVTEDDKRSAKRDGVELLLPEVHSDMPQPCLDWLNHYHMVHYPNIPRTLQYVVGHADVTSKAAKRIKEQSCQEAKLVLFNHEMPEDTAYFKTTKKAMQAPDKESRILEDAKSADAVFSVGPKIYSYFETNYKSLEEAGPRHYLFLPRASKVFENTNARPGGGQKVVLSFGRVSEVVVQKGHDLAARSLGYVPEHILRNLSWVVRGVRKDEDDWEKSRKILEKKMQKRIIKPTFRPFGTQEDIANDIKRAHLVLMTSRSEPFGLVGLEAIAAGIPVLISDQSGLADMIKDLSKKYKSLEDLRHRIVKTNVEESAVEETARRWADKITDTLEYSEGEFEKAAEFKKKLLESKYWEESNNDLLRVCGLIE